MDKQYIYKQLELIENILKDIHETMTQHEFDLTRSDVQNVIEHIEVKIENIRRELNPICYNLNKHGFVSVDISKKNRPEVRREIDRYLDN